MSRPKGTETPIDPAEIEKLASIGATQPEMAKWFGVSLSTIEKRLRRKEYRALLAKGEARFVISIRRKQAQLAEEGNATMLIWLGKQYLGQRDKSDNVHHGHDGKALLTLADVDRIIMEGREREAEDRAGWKVAEPPKLP